MVDIHSHIIWGIDDGSKSKEMTINMLKRASEGGTKKIVATPHFFRGNYECSYEEVKIKVDNLNTLAKENNIDIQVIYGQEVYYTENIFKYYTDGEIGTINNTKYMLIELPMDKFSISDVMDNLYEFTIQGIVPIIAHPERYIPFIKDSTLINRFIKEGYLFQLNAGSIEGYFGKDVKKTAEIFIENKVYSFVGSDAHRDTGRSINLREAKEIIDKLKKGYFKEMLYESERMLNNEDVEFNGKLVEKKKKGFLSIFKR